jgi:transcriptional regulator with XRE-family HTH domain
LQILQNGRMGTDVARILEAIGPRLRALRTGRGQTLSDLAEHTGIPVSTLSRLETGRRQPTLDLLLPLAEAHRISLDRLIAAPETGDPRLHLAPRDGHGSTCSPARSACSWARTSSTSLRGRPPSSMP